MITETSHLHFYQDADKFNINALELNLHVYQKM